MKFKKLTQSLAIWFWRMSPKRGRVSLVLLNWGLIGTWYSVRRALKGRTASGKDWAGVIKILETNAMKTELNHIAKVFYFRTSFDKHAAGLPREEAEKAAQYVCCRIWRDSNIAFPEVPWERLVEAR